MSLLAVLLAIAAAVLLRQPSKSRPDTRGAAPEPGAEPADVRSVEVLATQDAPGLTLTGRVLDAAGRPIPRARVSLASSAQPSLTTRRCEHCGEALLSCRAHETARTLSALFDAHRGVLEAALSTLADEGGRFRFERLRGTSFTVWATADGYGEGLKERAAPGDPVDLYLPARRGLVGQVKDEAGAPVAATVRVMSRRIAHPLEVQTEASGAFAVDGLGEGPFFVSATAPGRLPSSRLQVEAGTTPVTLTLASPRRLEVRLLSQGRLLDGMVVLEGDHLSRQLPTTQGQAVIDGLYPSALMVSAFSGERAATPQRVTLTGPLTRLDLSLDRGGRLSVTVLDEAGEPVPEPTLELSTRAGELLSRKRLRTGELAQLGPLGVGVYQLEASAQGFQSTVVPVTLSGGELALDVTLARATSIEGRVVDEYGRPAPGVAVLITPTGDSVTSDGEGRFRASVPSPGLYTLQAHHSDWGGGEVRVSAPKSEVELQLEPRAGAEVTVTVEGRRVEGAHAVLFHDAGNFRSDRPSGADGVVLMRGLPPDTYTLVASHPDFLPSDRQSVVLEDGRMVRIAAALKTGEAVKGQVVDTLGAPVSGVTVTVSPRGTMPAVTDDGGAFTLAPLKARESYSLRVMHRGYEQVERVIAVAGGAPVRLVVKRRPVFRGRVLGEGQPLKSFRVDDFEVTSSDGRFELALPSSDDRVVVTVEALGFEPVTQHRPNTPDLGDFHLTRAPLVTGLVKDEGAGPVAGAVVTCEVCEQSVLSGADGTFSLARPPFQKEFRLVAKKGRRTATRVVTDDAAQGLELVLKPGVQLSGTVWLSDGRPGAGVEISGVHVERSETLSAVTGADGTYAMEVPPGTYRFSIAMPGFERVAHDPPAWLTEVTGSQQRLDFGAVPGLGTVTARIAPQPGYALWLLKGTLRTVGNPPMELLRARWAQLVYQPRTDRVTFGGLEPGPYTLVWSSFHAPMPSGPLVVPVEVPTTGEVGLLR